MSFPRSGCAPSPATLFNTMAGPGVCAVMPQPPGDWSVGDEGGKKVRVNDQTRPGWRFHTGIILFAMGLISPVFIPLVTATGLSAGWKTALSGLLMLGIPELLWVVAAAIMGKAGFNHIKRKFWGFFKKMAPPDEVGPARYRIGLVMFSLPILFGWLAPFGVHRIPGYEVHRLVVNLIGDVLLISSLFVLGGDFWDKLRGLFIHKAKIKISVRESK